MGKWPRLGSRRSLRRVLPIVLRVVVKNYTLLCTMSNTDTKVSLGSGCGAGRWIVLFGADSVQLLSETHSFVSRPWSGKERMEFAKSGVYWSGSKAPMLMIDAGSDVLEFASSPSELSRGLSEVRYKGPGGKSIWRAVRAFVDAETSADA